MTRHEVLGKQKVLKKYYRIRSSNGMWFYHRKQKWMRYHGGGCSNVFESDDIASVRRMINNMSNPMVWEVSITAHGRYSRQIC